MSDVSREEMLAWLDVQIIYCEKMVKTPFPRHWKEKLRLARAVKQALIESMGERKPGTKGYHDVDEFYPPDEPEECPTCGKPAPAQVGASHSHIEVEIKEPAQDEGEGDLLEQVKSLADDSSLASYNRQHFHYFEEDLKKVVRLLQSRKDEGEGDAQIEEYLIDIEQDIDNVREGNRPMSSALQTIGITVSQIRERIQSRKPTVSREWFWELKNAVPEEAVAMLKDIGVEVRDENVDKKLIQSCPSVTREWVEGTLRQIMIGINAEWPWETLVDFAVGAFEQAGRMRNV